jgi:hypothetical protein
MGLGSAFGCARPSLPEGVDGPVEAVDAGRDAASAVIQERDAEVLESVEDAAPSPEPDASCPDRDGDSVCDQADNCPDDANRNQADADADGIGDVCSTTVINCEGEQLDTGSLGNNATLARVSINGQSRTLASVKAGSSVTINLFLTFDDCGTFAFPQVFLGFATDEVECKPAGFCSTSFTVPLGIDFTFDAPTEPGLHYLLAGISQSMTSCNPGTTRPDAGSAAAKRIAALCVTR